MVVTHPPPPSPLPHTGMVALIQLRLIPITFMRFSCSDCHYEFIPQSIPQEMNRIGVCLMTSIKLFASRVEN